jgi:hypothetical protein
MPKVSCLKEYQKLKVAMLTSNSLLRTTVSFRKRSDFVTHVVSWIDKRRQNSLWDSFLLALTRRSGCHSQEDEEETFVNVNTLFIVLLTISSSLRPTKKKSSA